jgi:hypothetical protein
VTEDIRDGLAARGAFGVIDVDPDVHVDQQGVTGPEHEQRGMEVEHAFIEKDVADPEDVAQEDDPNCSSTISRAHQQTIPPITRLIISRKDMTAFIACLLNMGVFLRCPGRRGGSRTGGLNIFIAAVPTLRLDLMRKPCHCPPYGRANRKKVVNICI